MTGPLSGVAGVVPRDAVTRWLVDVLAAAELPVGDNDLPVADQEDLQWPFLVVTDLPGGDVWGPPLASAASAVCLVYQVDAVGLREDQARMAADRATAAVLGRDPAGGWAVDPAAVGVRVLHREFDEGTPGGELDAEGDEPRKVWTAHLRFRIHAEEA